MRFHVYPCPIFRGFGQLYWAWRILSPYNKLMDYQQTCVWCSARLFAWDGLVCLSKRTARFSPDYTIHLTFHTICQIRHAVRLAASGKVIFFQTQAHLHFL